MAQERYHGEILVGVPVGGGGRDRPLRFLHRLRERLVRRQPPRVQVRSCGGPGGPEDLGGSLTGDHRRGAGERCGCDHSHRLASAGHYASGVDGQLRDLPGPFRVRYGPGAGRAVRPFGGDAGRGQEADSVGTAFDVAALSALRREALARRAVLSRVNSLASAKFQS